MLQAGLFDARHESSAALHAGALCAVQFWNDPPTVAGHVHAWPPYANKRTYSAAFSASMHALVGTYCPADGGCAVPCCANAAGLVSLVSAALPGHGCVLETVMLHGAGLPCATAPQPYAVTAFAVVTAVLHVVAALLCSSSC